MKKWIKRITIGILSIVLIGFLIPQNLKMPVLGQIQIATITKPFSMRVGELPLYIKV